MSGGIEWEGLFTLGLVCFRSVSEAVVSIGWWVWSQSRHAVNMQRLLLGVVFLASNSPHDTFTWLGYIVATTWTAMSGYLRPRHALASLRDFLDPSGFEATKSET